MITMRKTINPIELAIEKDKKYFKDHPNEKEYIRATIPGEFLPVEVPSWAKVRVTQLTSGVRMRRPF
jgi:hypothetical protein